MTAAGDPVELPPESEEVDYEGELAVIIGRAGRRIKIEDALGHVAGVSIANDVTMRDYQRRSHQWLQGKAWDACIPLGPELVTLDEVSDPKFTMVEPGDVILTGTPGGVGARRDPPVLLQPGDLVRVAISEIGFWRPRSRLR